MEEGVIVTRESIVIEGGRNLYSYSFREVTPFDRLSQMIETGEVGVVGPFLDLHADLDLPSALHLARESGHEEAVQEISNRMGL